MWFSAYNTHRVNQGHIAVIVICRIRIKLQIVILNSNLRECRCLRLTKHTGEQIKVILHIVMLVIKQLGQVLRIVILHACTCMRIITFMAASRTYEIERTVIRAIRTTLITGHILIRTTFHNLTVGNSVQNRRAVIRINRTYHLISMIMSLKGYINLTLLEGRQHTFSEQRRLLIHRVIRTGEQVKVSQRHTILRVRVSIRLLAEPITYMVRQIYRPRLVQLIIWLTPEILHREHQEQYITIHKTICNTLKLRLTGNIGIKRVIRIEVIRVIDIITIIMVTIRRNYRHSLDHRFHRFFKPAFPLPFRVVSIAVLHKIAGETAETCFRHRLHGC